VLLNGGKLEDPKKRLGPKSDEVTMILPTSRIAKENLAISL